MMNPEQRALTEFALEYAKEMLKHHFFGGPMIPILSRILEIEEEENETPQ